jgi:hypothetical protein
MAKSQRWMRLDTGIFDSEWVYMLDPLAQLAWIRLLLHVKTEGVKGTAKALSVPVASKKWGIPESDIRAMLAAAREDGALAEGAEWSVTNWAELYDSTPYYRRALRMKAAGGYQIPPTHRQYVLHRDNFTCQFCGATTSLTIDHIRPISKGGTHDVENLQVLCKPCNSAKCDKWGGDE